MQKKRNETKSVYVNTAHKNIFAQHKLTNRHASWTHSSHGQCCLINMSITPTVALGTHQVLLRTRGDTPKFNYFFFCKRDLPGVIYLTTPKPATADSKRLPAFVVPPIRSGNEPWNAAHTPHHTPSLSLYLAIIELQRSC